MNKHILIVLENANDFLNHSKSISKYIHHTLQEFKNFHQNFNFMCCSKII